MSTTAKADLRIPKRCKWSVYLVSQRDTPPYKATYVLVASGMSKADARTYLRESNLNAKLTNTPIRAIIAPDGMAGDQLFHDHTDS